MGRRRRRERRGGRWRGRGAADVASEFLASRGAEGRGLAGSAADRLAGRAHRATLRRAKVAASPGPTLSETPAADADPELAGLVGRVGRGRGGCTADDAGRTAPVRRPAVSSTRDRGRERERDRSGNAPRGTVRSRTTGRPGSASAGTRPTRRSRPGRTGRRQLPRVVLLFGALVIAALVLFFLPALLGLRRPEAERLAADGAVECAAARRPSRRRSRSRPPRSTSIKAGDTLSQDRARSSA